MSPQPLPSQHGLFDAPVLKLHRASDPPSSREAARAVAPRLTELHRRVLEVMRQDGPHSARQLEKLSDFADCGFSTVRKRVSELFALGRLRAVGSETSSGKTAATVYEAVTREGDVSQEH